MPNYVFNSSGHQIDLNVHVPQAISNAVDHARKVCRRDHIKAVDRIERAGIFVTELRRQLTQVPIEPRRQQQLIDGMCNRAQWTDVGVFNVSHYFQGNEMVLKDRVIEWVSIADTIGTADVESDTKAIIDELNGDLKAFDALISRAREINSEADRVLGGLVTLAEQNA